MRRVPSEKSNAVKDRLGQEIFVLVRLHRDVTKALRQLLALVIQQKG